MNAQKVKTDSVIVFEAEVDLKNITIRYIIDLDRRSIIAYEPKNSLLLHMYVADFACYPKNKTLVQIVSSMSDYDLAMIFNLDPDCVFVANTFLNNVLPCLDTQECACCKKQVLRADLYTKVGSKNDKICLDCFTIDVLGPYIPDKA